MKTFNRNHLTGLIESEGGPHITAYLPPLPQMSELEGRPIFISNLLRRVGSILTDHWMPQSEARSLLDPITELAHDREFRSIWRESIAIYLSGSFFGIYRLADSVAETLQVARRFCLRPVLPALHEVPEFYVLSLKKNGAALYRGSEESLTPVELVGFKNELDESLVELVADRGAQSHSATRAIHGKQGAVFHGQGGKPDAEKTRLTNFLQHLDEATHDSIADHDAYLIVAGVEFVTSEYRKVSHYRHLLDLGPVHDGDGDSLSKLQSQSICLVRQKAHQDRQAEIDTLFEHGHKPVTTNSEEILCAAHEGRIDTLVYDRTATLDGSFDPETGALKQLHHSPTGRPGDPCHDLIEMAAIETLRHDGRIHGVAKEEMPREAIFNAALRF